MLFKVLAVLSGVLLSLVPQSVCQCLVVIEGAAQVIFEMVSNVSWGCWSAVILGSL